MYKNGSSRNLIPNNQQSPQGQSNYKQGQKKRNFKKKPHQQGNVV